MLVYSVRSRSRVAALMAPVLLGSWLAVPVAHADCGPVGQWTPAQQQFFADMRSAGVIPVDGCDTSLFGAGVLLCQYIWYGRLNPLHMDALRRVVKYRDFNQIQAIAQTDLCPNGPIASPIG